MLEQETQGRGGPAGLAEAGERACRKLYTRMEMLVGPQGARAVLDHALRTARDQYAFLRAVQAGESQGECLKGLRESLEGHEARGLVALLAGTLGLLHSLLGRELVVSLLRGSWPGLLDCDECDFQEWEVRG